MSSIKNLVRTLVAILALTGCQHFQRTAVPAVSCETVAEADLADAGQRGFDLIGGSTALFMDTDIRVAAGMFENRIGKKELHLVVPVDVAALLVAHGYTRTGKECQMENNETHELIIKSVRIEPTGEPE